MDHNVAHDPTMNLLYGSASLAWVAHVVYEGLPPWSIVPALAFAGIAIVKAWNDAADRRQQRRHAEELHALEMARRASPAPGVTFVPTIERLN